MYNFITIHRYWLVTVCFYFELTNKVIVIIKRVFYRLMSNIPSCQYFPYLQFIAISLNTCCNIKYVCIADSPEQYQNLHIFVSNSSMESQNGTSIYSGNATNNNMFQLTQTPSKLFRYLMIKRLTNVNSVLTICEVQMYEAGMNCMLMFQI